MYINVLHYSVDTLCLTTICTRAGILYSLPSDVTYWVCIMCALCTALDTKAQQQATAGDLSYNIPTITLLPTLLPTITLQPTLLPTITPACCHTPGQCTAITPASIPSIFPKTVNFSWENIWTHNNTRICCHTSAQWIALTPTSIPILSHQYPSKQQPLL